MLSRGVAVAAEPVRRVVGRDQVAGDGGRFDDHPAGRRDQRRGFAHRVHLFEGAGRAVLFFALALSGVDDQVVGCGWCWFVGEELAEEPEDALGLRVLGGVRVVFYGKRSCWLFGGNVICGLWSWTSDLH